MKRMYKICKNCEYSKRHYKHSDKLICTHIAMDFDMDINDSGCPDCFENSECVPFISIVVKKDFYCADYDPKDKEKK